MIQIGMMVTAYIKPNIDHCWLYGREPARLHFSPVIPDIIKETSTYGDPSG
jgi:hypothetical protein